MVASAAPVIMLVAPGPIDEVQAKVRRRLLALAYAAARCTPDCSLRTGYVRKIGILLQRLADAGHVAVAEDPQHAGEEWVLFAIPLDVLVLQKAHQCLSHRDATRFHAVSPQFRSEPARQAIQVAPPVRRHRFQCCVHGPALVHDSARRFRHGQRIFVAGVQNVSAHQCAADIRSRGQRRAELAQERRRDLRPIRHPAAGWAAWWRAPPFRSPRNAAASATGSGCCRRARDATPARRARASAVFTTT